MRKWMIIPVLAVLLAGCAEQVKPETAPPETSPEPPTEYEEIVLQNEQARKIYDGVELTFSLSDSQDSPEAEVLTQAADVFKDATGAQVVFRYSEPEYHADIMAIEGSALPERRGDLLELTDLAAASDYELHSVEFLQRQVIERCGSLKAIPWEPEVWGVYCNREIMQQNNIAVMPEDWDSFMTICSILRNKGYQIMALDEQKAVMATTLHLERTFGWDTLKKLDRKNGDLQQSLQKIIDFLNCGYLSGGWTEDSQTLQSRIALRNAVMFVGSNLDCTAMEDALSCDLQWEAFAWPGTGEGTGTAADARVLAVSADCKESEAAFDFIMLLTTGEFDQLRADLTKGIPADPNNLSPIAGASELLQKANKAPEALPGEMPLAIWQSRYKDGTKAAKAWQKP